jgi:hypothetical protein
LNNTIFHRFQQIPSRMRRTTSNLLENTATSSLPNLQPNWEKSHFEILLETSEVIVQGWIKGWRSQANFTKIKKKQKRRWNHKHIEIEEWSLYDLQQIKSSVIKESIKDEFEMFYIKFICKLTLHVHVLVWYILFCALSWIFSSATITSVIVNLSFGDSFVQFSATSMIEETQSKSSLE